MKFFLITTMVLLASFAFSCEVCGCSASGGTMGSIGASKSHLLGFTFQSRYFNSKHPELFGTGVERSREQFYTTALVGKYQAGHKWQLLGIVPVHFNRQQKNGTQTASNGLGDASVQLRFAPIIQQDSISQRAFILQLGVGSKLPTGQFSDEAHETTNLFPGTGSWDFPFDLNVYAIRSTWMFQWENSVILKTANRIGYRYGNSLQSSIYAQHSWGNKHVKLSPGIGVRIEYLQSDQINGSAESTVNGGYLCAATPGINFEWKSLFVIARYVHPISQHLSKGYTTASPQFVASMYYTFKSKK